ncbi:hypothetical protein [Mucilaginibacter agri]|uniref:Uncharacterized protein n=1 Tax=Mucilaginibacter agri TaxID=2695265 RepID=A0A965ZF04_9SPHI|nr:hypothetical protein [Mucilaginibacter agri]NCD69690.1 hypothetical protein [Mucilaginibacter agri]
MKLKFLLTALLLLTIRFSYADAIVIKHFIVKANPFAKDEIAILAADSTNEINEQVSGNFIFTVNGFEDTLKFEKGTAFYRHKIAKSSFVYVKHHNDEGTFGTLYYLYKSSNDIVPVHISWVWLLAIPAALVILGYLFKRFIIIAVILFLIFMYFNHSNGLSMPTFFESVLDGLKNMF